MSLKNRYMIMQTACAPRSNNHIIFFQR